jgi:3-mercaptopyruvate sulfurtransferase SseA
VKAEYIMPRLGDPYYQILDVRSREEYLGEVPNTALDGTVLKLGHVPTAYNNDYTLNWVTPDSKAIKNYAALQELYQRPRPRQGGDHLLPFGPTRIIRIFHPPAYGFRGRDAL